MKRLIRAALACALLLAPGLAAAQSTISSHQVSDGAVRLDARLQALDAVDAGKQPLDSDLTAIAGLSTTPFGRSLLAAADAAALRVLAGTRIGTDVEAWDGDLDSIAALATTSYGRSLLTLADAAAGRSTLGLATVASSGSAADLSSGTLPAGRLPAPTVSSLGGVQALAAVSHRFLTAIGTDGVPVAAQPACADLSNAAASCATDATNASNISSGVLAAARGGAGTVSGALKGDGAGAVSQAAASDLTNGTTGSGAVALATSPSFTTPNIGAASGTSLATTGSLSTTGGNVRVHVDSGVVSWGAADDVVLTRDAANTLAQRNGASAQTYNLYNTTDGTNKEYASLTWGLTANQFRISMQKAGTGSDRILRLTSAQADAQMLGSTNASGAMQLTGNVGTVASASGIGLTTTMSATSGTQTAVLINPTVSQSSTAGYTALVVNPTESSTGSGSKLLADFQVGGVSKVSVSNTGLINAQSTVAGANLQAFGSGLIKWAAQSAMLSPSDGVIEFTNNAGTDFTRLQLGGTTSSFPAIKKNGTGIDFRLADDSAMTDIRAAKGTFAGTVTAQFGQVVAVRVVTAAGGVTVTTSDYIVAINKTSGAATAVTLPAGVAGQRFCIKDAKGDAATNNITISPAAGTIDGASTYVISTNRGSVWLTYSGSEWLVS